MKQKHIHIMILFVSVLALQLSLAATAWSAEQPAEPAQPQTQAPAAEPSGAQRMNTESIKEKYWARGDESEIGVVQNRLYEKEHRWEFSLLGGIANTDPMLTVWTLGSRVGYHFSEYFSLHLIGWKAFSSPSGTQ